jgi:spermidine synthase
MESKMSTKIRSLLFSLMIYTAFFASGAASLISEVTWNRMLIVVVGNSLNAAALIIMVFMGGLGLGSFFGGRVFSNRRPSLAPYMILECCIGLFVLLSPRIFDALAVLFSSMAGSIDDRGDLTLIRVVVSVLALLVPAFLMGATFPAMINVASSKSASRRSARTGYLYSANTIGAALGTFAAGYHLLLELGVQFTLNVAGGLYAAAAICALVAHLLMRGDALSEETEPASETTESSTSLGRPWVFLGVATFLVGFVSLAYEVMLTRLSILYLGNSVSVFPLVLTGFLLGTGISAVVGTWLYGKLRDNGMGERLFGIVSVVAGLLLMVTPYILLSDRFLSPSQMARFADETHRNPLPILGLIVLPTVMMGALLPIAIRMLQAGTRGDSTRRAASLYSLNTAGGLLGAGLVNHYLVPLIGVQSVLVFLSTLFVAIGAVNILDPWGRPRRVGMAVLATGLAAVLLATVPTPLMDLYAGKLAVQTEAHQAEVLLLQEGRAAMVAVIDQFDDSKGTYRDMYLNGVEEASTRYWHVQLFKLLGILPVLSHESDDPKDAMVIAFGAGITAGSVLASDEVASLDVVDLNPDIEGINDLFIEVNDDVYHKDRFHFHNDDGRNYLVTSNKQYDLIIGDSTHPRAYDSWILYTEEFYEAVKQRLKPGGIFAQWVPVMGSMRGELFNIHLNTFRSVFPNTTFWYIYGCDQAFLMATPDTYTLDVERLQSKLDKLPDWFRAEEFQIQTPTQVAGFFWQDKNAMEAMIGNETRINTDDLHYFDKQSAVWPLPPQLQLPMFQASVIPHVVGADQAMLEDIAQEQYVGGLLSRYGFYGTYPDLLKAYCTKPENGNAQYYMSLKHEGNLPDPGTVCESDEISGFRTLVEAHPDNASALNGLADLLAAEGRIDEALPFAERAMRLTPDDAAVLDTYGWILHLHGRDLEGLEVMKKAAGLLPDHPIVNFHYGVILEAMGNKAQAKERLEKALEAPGDYSFAEEAEGILKQLD